MSNNQYTYILRPRYKLQLEDVIKQHVSIETTPRLPNEFDLMKPGVIKDIDRDYTYDVVPEEIDGGILYQPIHRIPLGTSIKLNVLKPMTMYFIFHNGCDGNYTNIFKTLEGWELCKEAPQYDINCEWDPEHGLHMTMYKMKALPGIYNIPAGEKGVKTDWACWNIVFTDFNNNEQ